MENRLSAPHNWIHVRVFSELPGADDVKMVGDYADYMVHIRQPPMSLRDLDPGTFGVESSPIVLDSSGYGRAHPGKNPTLVPALEWCHDVDTFQFQSTSPGSLTVTVDGTVGEVNPHVRIYQPADADGYRLIAESSTSNPQRTVEIPIHNAEPRKPYYLVVDSYDDATNGLYIVQVRQRAHDDLTNGD